MTTSPKSLLASADEGHIGERERRRVLSCFTRYILREGEEEEKKADENPLWLRFGAANSSSCKEP